MTLRLPGLIGLRHLCSITSRSAASLASRAASDLAWRRRSSVARRLRSSIRSCFQRTRSTSLSSTLTLRPTSRLSKAGIVDVHVLDVDLFHRPRRGSRSGPAWPPRRASWRSTVRANDDDRAFHALEHVDAQQVDQALLAVHLAEEALAAANLGAVFLVVGRLLVRQHVAQRRVGGEVQAADLVVDLADRAELAGAGPRRA